MLFYSISSTTASHLLIHFIISLYFTFINYLWVFLIISSSHASPSSILLLLVLCLTRALSHTHNRSLSRASRHKLILTSLPDFHQKYAAKFDLINRFPSLLTLLHLLLKCKKQYHFTSLRTPPILPHLLLLLFLFYLSTPFVGLASIICGDGRKESRQTIHNFVSRK